MRSQKTVLVLGAGASKGFGLPLGSELKGLLAKDLNILFDDFGTRLSSGSPEIVDALRLLSVDETGRRGNINPHRAAAVRIAGAMALSGSIDEYVERHKDDKLCEECAKLGIAKAILNAEKRSNLYSDYNPDSSSYLSKSSDTWLGLLLRDLTRARSKSELTSAFSNLSIINFNYDRCVEEFIFLWLQRMYNLLPQEAEQVCKSVSIFHPYGKIADLPHENPHKHIAFGGACDAHRLVEMARSIRTYSEVIEESPDLATFRSAIAEAAKIVFLGFGFHQQNMDLLTVSAQTRATAQCYATVDGISDPRIEMCKSQLHGSLKLQASNGLFFYPFKGNCEAFWQEYGDVVVH